MRIVVQKFGGTSVASKRDREAAAKQIEAALANSYGVVVVVSAMGRSGQAYATDTLLSLIDNPHRTSIRDLDMLMSCGEVISAVVFANMLRQRGHRVTVLNGQQAGVITDERFNNANILDVRPSRILEALEKSHVVVVTGYQGISQNGEITTLGRGGSDITALALGAALRAEYVDIFTDVEGIMTADPRIVPSARKLPHITYTDTYTLAHHGAKVIHPRAVQVAEKGDVQFRVRNMYSSDLGTLVSKGGNLSETNRAPRGRVMASQVHPAPPVSQHRVLRGSVYGNEPRQAWFSQRGDDSHQDEVLGLTHLGGLSYFQTTAEASGLGLRRPDAEESAFSVLLSHLTLAGLNVNHVSIQERKLIFTVPSRDADVVNNSLVEFGFAPVPHLGCAKVTVVGSSGSHADSSEFEQNAAVKAYVQHCLAEQSIPLLQLGHSTNSVWCLVPEGRMEHAVQTLHDGFELARSPQSVAPQVHATSASAAAASATTSI